MKPFHAATAPLAHGVTLIEASAGTGKTYSIAALFLRLVLEEGVPIHQILAVTYTEAATKELRERIRTRLREALAALRSLPGSTAASDPVIEAFRAANGDSNQAATRLELAVQCFDEARIFTIHGFCQRALRDHAFESGTRYEAELVADSRPLLEEVASDFWRRSVYGVAPPTPFLAALAVALGKSHETWAGLLHRTRNHANLVILPGAGGVSCAEQIPGFTAAFEAIRCEWLKNGAEIEQILRSDKALSRNDKTFRPDCMDRLVDALRPFCSANASEAVLTPECLAALEKCRASFLAANTLKQKPAPQHRFFDLCETFCTALQTYFDRLVHEFLEYAKTELAARKQRRNILNFDDLLTALHQGLVNIESSAALTASVGERYRAALIDEFQDTDPLQYEIFRRLFASGAHRLFFIGDPKQAIYGFRGADIETYLKAVACANERFTLTVNWRSDALLLAAFNRLFAAVENPFVNEQIQYHPVDARPDAAPHPAVEQPLRFRYIPTPEGQKQLGNKEHSTALAVEAAAADIAAALASGAWLPRDLAALVRSNRQAAAMQTALRAHGVRSVLHTEASVFKTPEAEELQRVLEAIAEPRNDRRLKVALATRLMAFTVTKIAALGVDERERQTLLERLHVWRGHWETGSFIAMFRRLLVEENLRQRLVESTDGERRLTNLLHLAELLHEEETARRLSPESLCDWLRDQRQAAFSSSDATQLRMESDDDAVTLATVHKSKGLEYKAVFCPFLWIPGASKTRTEVQFHDDDGRLTFDLRDQNAPDAHKARHAQEALAEETRLLYVAVTRAKHLCTIYAVNFKGAAESALAALFPGNQLRAGMEALAHENPDAVSFSLVESDAAGSLPFEETGPVAEPSVRQFAGSLASAAFVTSFTGLTAGTSREEPERDRPSEPVQPEAEPPEDQSEAPAAGIFQFEKGARAGNFFHDVMEHVDFTKPGELDWLVPDRLARHGFSGSPFTDAIKAALREVLAVELESGLRLQDVAKADRLSEVEFSCRLNSLKPADLAELFADVASAATDPDGLGRLQFSPVLGFLRGAIDLVFRHEERYYIADWKSNWLGNRPEDYNAAGVNAAMRHHHYPLQAHLYVLAADRFLARRVKGYDYETHFGGVFYLFLRGVDRAAPAQAIYRDRPPLEHVRKLRRLAM